MSTTAYDLLYDDFDLLNIHVGHFLCSIQDGFVIHSIDYEPSHSVYLHWVCDSVFSKVAYKMFHIQSTRKRFATCRKELRVDFKAADHSLNSKTIASDHAFLPTRRDGRRHVVRIEQASFRKDAPDLSKAGRTDTEVETLVSRAGKVLARCLCDLAPLN